MPTAGYSGTPLAKKLGIKSGFKYWVYKAPGHYFDLFDDLPSGLNKTENLESEMDFVHLFCTDKEDLKQMIPEVKGNLKKEGLTWISWPKGSSKIPTDINREVVRELGLASGLVDVKVAAIDEDWSGLKFVYRKKDRK